MPRSYNNRPSLTHTLLSLLFLAAEAFIPGQTEAGRLRGGNNKHEGLNFGSDRQITFNEIPFASFHSIPSISVPSVVLTAVGRNLTDYDDLDDEPPLLVVSNDSGKTWAAKSVSGLTASGEFEASSCFGNVPSTICIAAGIDTIGISPPLLASSRDGANTWATQIVPGVPSGGFYSISCAGNETSAICIAAGQYYYIDPVEPPLLVASLDGANSWAVVSVPDLAEQGVFYTSSCTDSGASAICIAAGWNNSSKPLLVASNDGSKSWAVKSVDGAPADQMFISSSCAGNGSSAVCIAVGSDDTDDESSLPLLVASSDGSKTWSVKSVPGVSASGSYQGSGCTDSGSSVICTAVGIFVVDGYGAPLLVASKDSGNTWAIQSIPGLPTYGMFSGSSCTTGSDFSVICSAVGSAGTYGKQVPAIIASSTDGSKTWAMKSVAGLPKGDGSFETTSCSNSGSSVICTAAGNYWDDQNARVPLLAISMDGSKTWSVVEPSTIANLPMYGLFVGSGSTSSSKSSLRDNSHRNTFFGMKKKSKKDLMVSQEQSRSIKALNN